LTAIEPDVVTIDSRHVFAELKIWAEALQLPCSKQWEKAIYIKYNNLVYNSVIE